MQVYTKFLWPPWPPPRRMVVLETRQIDDQTGMSNLSILEIAENYVMLPWLSVYRRRASWETPDDMWMSPQDSDLSSVTLMGMDVTVF